MRFEHASKRDECAHDLDVDAIASALRRTLDNIATPCSVKAYGAFRRPPRPTFAVTICDLKDLVSCAVSRNMKSDGKRSRLRLTA